MIFPGATRRALMLLFAIWVAAAINLIAPATRAAAQGQPPTAEPRTTLPDVEDEVMCPVCGTTLELATEAPQAIREREYIRELIAEGKTKEKIKDALVAEYGPEVLAVPDTEGFDLVAWLAPGAAILAAGIAIFLGLRRWRRDAATDAAAEAGRQAETPLSEADATRLDADLKRYEP